MMPWVMSKLDYRLEHLLVDEAQDTSPVQWQLIQALVGEIIAQAEQAANPKTLFVVGDEKQSIYSFQGAAPWLLAQMKQHFMEQLSASAAPLGAQELAVSYRSADAILKVVNAVCLHGDVAAAFSEGAAPEHQLHHKDVYGHVELWPLVETEEKPELPPYTIPTDYYLQASARRRLAEQVVHHIAQLLEQKTLIRGKQMQPRDVLILVQGRNEMVPALIQSLEALHIPVAGIDRLYLNQHIAVKDIMALIAWCFQPADNVALAQVLRSPLIGISEEALFELAYGRGEETLWQRTANTPHAEPLERWRSLRHQDAYPFIHHVLEVDGAAKRYSRRMGQEVLEVLDELLAIAANKHGTREANLLLFMQTILQDAPEIKRDSAHATSNHVRIMTVHGAKGLEAPVVFLVDTTKTPDLKKEMVYYSHDGAAYLQLSEDAENAAMLALLKQQKKQQLFAEYYRLLYVALTRAADRLYITGTALQKNSKLTHWYDVTRTQMLTLPYVEEEGRIIIASGIMAEASASHEAPVSTPQKVPTWINQTPVKEVVPRVFSPSRIGDDEPVLATQSTTIKHDARAYGIMLHQLLQWAPDTISLEETLRFAASMNATAMGEDLYRDISRLFADDAIADMLKMPCNREQVIAGEIMVNGVLQPFSGSIDRLMVTENEVLVIDYKTSFVPPAAPAATPRHYALQMKAYHALLEKRYPKHHIKLGLLWTSLPRLDWINDVVAQCEWPALDFR